MSVGDIERDLKRLEADLKQLEVEYTMYFAGRLPKPPWEARARVDAAVRKLDRTPTRNTAARFRFSTIQARYSSLGELWDRSQRTREEGRHPVFGVAERHGAGTSGNAVSQDGHSGQLRHLVVLRDVHTEADKLESLYDALSAARREVGMRDVSFEKFCALVSSHVEKVRAGGIREVAFRVSVRDGKVSLTARASKEAHVAERSITNAPVEGK